MNRLMQIPEIRFEGFIDDWVIDNLGAISEHLTYGLNAAAKEYDGENKYLRITDIDDDSRDFIQTGLTSPEIIYMLADDYLLYEGDVLFARTGASVGKSYRYRLSDGKVYFAGFLIRARIKEEYDSEFIFQNTLTERYNKFVRLTSQRSGQPGINAQEYSNFEIVIPDKEEQTAIGNFFRNLDDTIAHKKQHHEKTLNIKKAMLEKMFPKKGADVPEIRFEGFDEPWIEQPLENIFAIRNGYTPSKDNEEFWKDGSIPWFRMEDIRQNGRILSDSIQHITPQAVKGALFPAYSIIIATTATIGEHALIIVDSLANQQFTSIKIDVNRCHKIDSYYAFYCCYLLSDWCKSNTNSGGLLAVDMIGFKKFLFKFPSFEEQVAISSFFRNLDTLIEAEQQEIEKLQNIKKACLSKMFV